MNLEDLVCVGTHIKVGEFSLTVFGDGEGLKTLRHPKIVC